MTFPRIASFKTSAALRDHLRACGLSLDLDDAVEPGPNSPAGAATRDGWRHASATASPSCPWRAGTARPTGEPRDLTRRRWQHFGISGAKLIWGGEAVAVRQDGRANPNQLLLTPSTQASIARLREELVSGSS